ncbi:MAG TPA: EAL domain-containing protein [Geminicoccaceae bacterium]|nr:EAL domain-containing protein [Geminicoccaceae bacterium]
MNGAAPGYGLNDRLVRVFGSSASLRDALVLLAAAVLAVVLETFVDLLPSLAAWSQQHPAWQIDKLFTLLLVMAVGFFAFAIRRMREIGAVARRRSEVEARFRDFAAMADEWFWETDDQLRLTEVDDKAPAAVAALARRHASWEPYAAGEAGWARHRAELAARKPFRGFRFHLTDDTGAVHHIQISGKPFFDRAGRFRGYRGTASDVTSAVAAEVTSEHLARFDPLTDLPNRAQLCDEVDHAAALARARRRPAALLRIDLDRFREINDTLGPTVGDLLLKACARRLAGCIAEADRLARISGDEFAIVQQGPDQPDGAVRLAQEVLASFAEPFELEGQEVIASASVGVALTEGDQASDEVIKSAGIALYRAKHEGRATACLFEPGMEAELRRRRALEWDLKRGLQEGEFQLVYQPQIDAATRSVVGVEALVRWLHPERGLLEAKDFVADADETGMILPLGAWVLHSACAEAARWPELRVAVNLSPLQFRHRDLAALVGQALAATGLEPGRLELEVPEAALLAEPDAADILEELRRLGVRLAFADFAQGCTSLAHQHGFAFDQVKIDRLYTASLADRPDAQAGAHAIEAIAHGLGRTVCAEGVETAEQETLMTTAGCALLQGEYYSGPITAGELVALLGGGVGPTVDSCQPAASAA